jgi:hypothetical protein
MTSSQYGKSYIINHAIKTKQDIGELTTPIREYIKEKNIFVEQSAWPPEIHDLSHAGAIILSVKGYMTQTAEEEVKQDIISALLNAIIPTFHIKICPLPNTGTLGPIKTFIIATE